MLEKVAIYLDSNAGAPLKPVVVEALLPYFRENCVLIPNPSSIHRHGRHGKRILAEAKSKIAISLGLTQPRLDFSQFHFTSSGTEANQTVLRSVFEPLIAQGKHPHWITTRAEHDSNRQMVDWLKSRGGSVSFIPLDSEGVLQVHLLKDLMTPHTALISAIWVNNETGVISDVASLARIAQSFSIPLHLDAAQAWGKIPIDLNHLGADWVTFSGHKIGAFAGVGLLWTAHPKDIRSSVLGKQDLGRRGGTENLVGILGLGAAASAIDPEAWSARVLPLRNRLEAEIIQRIPGVLLNGGAAPRIANTLNLSFDGLESEGLVMALDLEGYSVSAGSACSSGVLEPSEVLLAMGRSVTQSKSALRISLPDALPWQDLLGFVDSLEKVVVRFRHLKPRRRKEAEVSLPL